MRLRDRRLAIRATVKDGSRTRAKVAPIHASLDGPGITQRAPLMRVRPHANDRRDFDRHKQRQASYC
jgi:hypothetical protein